MWRASPPPSASTAWLAVAAAVATLVVAGAVVVLGGAAGPQPPFLAEAQTPAPPIVRVHDPRQPLGLAGSGSNLPITRALVAASGITGPLPVVHPSIGSGGGIRALLDGVVDIALVSRPLNERERALGLIAIPYARVPVAVVVHSDVPDQDISAPQLVAVFAGHQRTWADGSRITVLQRERGDSSHRSVSVAIAGFAETNDEAYREGRWRVLYHDDAMTDALDSTPGAIGLFGQGSMPATRSIRALTVDGVAPTRQAVAEQRYPFTKDLAFVTVAEPTGRVAAFMDFVRSPAGRRIIEDGGAVALANRGRAPEPVRQEDP